MISNNLHKIRIKTMSRYMYLGEYPIDMYAPFISDTERLISRKEFRIIKQNFKFTRCPEE